MPAVMQGTRPGNDLRDYCRRSQNRSFHRQMSGIHLQWRAMQRLPPLIELRAFEAAARHMSFKRAADELGVTPTAISHQVRLLESFFGQPLFRRRPRPLSLTSAGARLFPVIRDGFDSFASCVTALRERPDGRPLRVTATNAFACRWLVPRLSEWQRVSPGIAIEVIGTDSVLSLRDGEADVAIRYAYAAPSGGVVRELLRDRFFPICSPALLSKGPRIRRPADLIRHTLIHCFWAPDNSVAPTWRRWLQVAGSADPDLLGIGTIGHLNFTEELHAIEAVIAGQGIAVLSDVLVERELATGTLVKALDIGLEGLGFYIIYLPNHAHRSAIEAFSSWIGSVR
jgi:LysR family glycine cleavage system transcriptional activator